MGEVWRFLAFAGFGLGTGSPEEHSGGEITSCVTTLNSMLGLRYMGSEEVSDRADATYGRLEGSLGTQFEELSIGFNPILNVHRSVLSNEFINLVVIGGGFRQKEE